MPDLYLDLPVAGITIFRVAPGSDLRPIERPPTRYSGTFYSPNITPHPEDGIAFTLRFGLTPDGDSPGSSMGHVISDSTSWLSAGDLAAIAEYLKTAGVGVD